MKCSPANDPVIGSRVGIGTICSWLKSNLYSFGDSDAVCIGYWKELYVVLGVVELAAISVLADSRNCVSSKTEYR